MDTFKANAKTDKNKKVILSHLPHSPGVYIYRNDEGTILYIGKAIDLFNRVHQYFKTSNLPPKTYILVKQIDDIQIIKTLSEFDALLLEAKLIYEHQPKYNILAKDDKSPLYVKLTLSEDLPRIMFIRKPRTPSYGTSLEHGDVVFGPFQSGKMVRSIMRVLRHSIPYCTQKVRNGSSCFYTQIGLCSPCPSYISGLKDSEDKQKLQNRYRQNIFRLRDILSGKASGVLSSFEKEMKENAAQYKFEQAAHIRNQLTSLYDLIFKQYDPMLFTQDSMIENLAENEIESLLSVLNKAYPQLKQLKRIECIDISNTSGTNATGSMVVLTNGLIDTNEYRRFKIQQRNISNDVGMIGEVLKRRFSHSDWPLPDVCVVDGGKPQVAKAISVLTSMNVNIPIIGLAKRQEEIVVLYNSLLKIIRLPLTDPAIHLLQRIRDEAHRFAITYHRKLRSRSFISS